MEVKPVKVFLTFLFLCLSLSAFEKRPNILFAIADDMSHASAYGWKFLKTPHFDSVASKGILFNKAYTPSSKCAPSRSVIITGRNPWQLEDAANHQPYFPKKFKSVVEALGENGYFTGFTGKGWGPGDTAGRDLTGPEFNNKKVKKSPAKYISKIDYTENFKDFMSQKPVEQPFFFWFGCKEPHRAYEYGTGQKNGKKINDLDFLPAFWGNDDSVKNDILDYAVEVEYFDRHLGAILNHLEELDEIDNTLIIVTSDNSMPFPRFKGHPYELSTRIPFSVMWPAKIKKPGRTTNKFMSFIDLAPTFLEVAGLSPEKAGMQPIQGKSLFDFFADNVVGRDKVLTGRERNDIGRPHDQGYPVRSLNNGKYYYMHNFEADRWPCGNPETGYLDTDKSPTKNFTLSGGEGSLAYDKCFGKKQAEELYDLEKDPECMDNLAYTPEYKEILKRMKQQLFEDLKAQGDPRMHGKGHVFDAYKHSKSPGFYEKLKQRNKK